MLKIKYNKLYEEKSYRNMVISIIPDNSESVSVLREMLNENFTVENPCKTFARLMKNGELEKYPEHLIEEYANCVNLLSDAWEGKPYENIMMIAVGLAQIIIKQKSNIFKDVNSTINEPNKITNSAFDDSC